MNSSRQAPAPELSVGQSVAVTGRVEEFGLEEAERETEVDPNDEALEEREGKTSIFATTVDAEGQGGTTRQD